MNSFFYRPQKGIKQASKQELADCVIKNGLVVDVFNGEIVEMDIAITDGMISGLGSYDGHEEIDAKGAYVVPGLIDSHVHIESSMVTPKHFGDLLLQHGVTTALTDPHEIANVTGEKGLDFMLKEAEKTACDLKTLLPSCVPSTPFEHAGATLSASDLEEYYTHNQVIGLAEVMDFPSVQTENEDMMAKISSALTKEKHIDGHGAGLSNTDINVYATAGIKTDHESTTLEEAKARLQRGLYVMIRQGSGAKDFQSLIPLVRERNAHRFLFCTDDKHLTALMEEGSIDHHIRLAIEYGLDPVLAIQMATLNPAVCYGLKQKGAIAPGYEATFLFVDDLPSFSIRDVFVNGERVHHDLQKQEDENDFLDTVTDTVQLPNYTKEDFKISMDGTTKANIIEIQPNSIVSKHVIDTVPTQNDEFTPSPEQRLYKMAVLERHGKTNNIGLGIIKELPLKEGAIATSIAHDSHNIVAAGCTDEDLITAIEHLKNIQGGLVIVSKQKIVASLALPIAGLMAHENIDHVSKQLKYVHKALEKQSYSHDFDVFLTLSFMCLPVIPALKLTDIGLFDVHHLKHIEVPVHPTTETT
ncbi:adenine deaminase [Texcoconibacillus texcoconensis]|uniref:Adenine deaminase n=1 Tax=Texcoconibacillus texcoconensis TaxID=1095777 RepID=A0A840QTK5_9BACI|nr:adenine deaminase [Texcoconibacillus texcoconensis]